MKIFKYSILFAMLLGLFACKKEDVTPDVPSDEVPVFKAVGTIDGIPVSFQAGVNGAFLSTYTANIEGVDRFSGKIIQGQNFADFGLYNGNLMLPTSSFVFSGTNLRFASPTITPLFSLNKDLMANAEIIESIDIQVNGVSVGENLIIYEPGIYTICVDVNYLDELQENGTVCNQLILGYTDFGMFNINHNVSGTGMIQANISTLIGVANVNWFVDDNYVSSGTSFSGSLAADENKLKAEVTFSNGVVASREIFVNTFNQSVYVEDLCHFVLPLESTFLRDFKVDLSIMVNGTLYTHVASTNQTEIELTEVSYYGLNANGKDVYKLTGVVNALMKNNTTMEIVNAQLDVVFGIEIP
jgi:hypothetical protein